MTWVPPDIDPGRLFRLLLQFPRPVTLLDYRLPSVPHEGLYVRALRSTELAWALDGATDVPADVGSSVVVSRVLAAAVCLRRGVPAFDSPEDAGVLSEHEAAALFRHVDQALRIVSPTYLTADIGEWTKALRRGCYDNANLCDALALGGCYSVSWGFGKKAVHVRDEPERFFGCAQRDLLDCHWMAFRAAQQFKIDLDRKAS